MLRLAAALLLLSTTARADTLAADLAAMKPAHAHPNRATLLGWTEDHRVAYRAVVCSEDHGGGRGPYCALMMCTSALGDVRGTWSPEPYEPMPACEEIVALDLNAGEAPRKAIDRADAEAKAATWREQNGPLTAGKPLSTGRARVARSDDEVRATVTGFSPISLFHKSSEPGRSNARAIAITEVSRSPDGACVAVVGRLTVETAYEGVPVDVPTPFGAVACNLKTQPIP